MKIYLLAAGTPKSFMILHESWGRWDSRIFSLPLFVFILFDDLFHLIYNNQISTNVAFAVFKRHDYFTKKWKNSQLFEYIHRHGGTLGLLVQTLIIGNLATVFRGDFGVL